MLMDSIKLIVLFFLIISVDAKSACTRTFSYNGEIRLLDGHNLTKGEGLREIFEGHPESLELLDKYQDNYKVSKRSIILGGIGSVGIISGLFLQHDKELRDRALILGGVAIALNYFLTETIIYYNRSNLQKAIDLYNKKNKNKIELGLSPLINQKGLKLFANWSF